MLIGYLGVKLTLPIRSRSVDVLRPVVELINFNMNVIKNVWIPCVSFFFNETDPKRSVVVLLTGIRTRCGLVLQLVILLLWRFWQC